MMATSSSQFYSLTTACTICQIGVIRSKAPFAAQHPRFKDFNTTERICNINFTCQKNCNIQISR